MVGKTGAETSRDAVGGQAKISPGMEALIAHFPSKFPLRSIVVDQIGMFQSYPREVFSVD